MIDKFGYEMRGVDPEQIRDMFYPVRCTHCQGVYDAGKVVVTARYLDCSMWKAPCCGLTVDDRPTGLKFRSDIVRLDRNGREEHR